MSPNASRHPTDGSTISHKPSYRTSKRLVGLAERDKDAESADDDEWDSSPSAWDPRADMDPTNRRNMKQSQDWMAIQNAKIATSHGYRTTSKRLLASPPSSASASPQSPAFTPPMLSMAKLIMHRHDQLSKRARSPKSAAAAALPPSPPPAGSTSFGSMQYTLKSATIKNEKLALVAFPNTEPEPPSSSSTSNQSPPPHHDTEKGSPSQPHPPSKTRHARNRSVALPSISLPSISSIPSLVPALQLLQSKPSQDRTVRRRPSSLLEEGGSSASTESLPTHSRKPSSESSPSMNEAIDINTERRASESMGELEKGRNSSR